MSEKEKAMKLTSNRVYTHNPLLLQDGDDIQNCEIIQLRQPAPFQIIAGSSVSFKFNVIRSARVLDRLRFWWLRRFTRRLLELKPGFWVMP